MGKIDFRKYYLKPIKVELNESLSKKYNLDNSSATGIVFVNDGINLKVISLDDKLVKDKSLIFKNISQEDLQIEMVNENDIADYTVLKKDIEKTYGDEHINKLRKMTKFDSIRDNKDPDIVSSILFTKNKGIEELKTRLIMPTDSEDLYAAQLLDDSVYDNEFKKNDYIATKYIRQDNEDYMIVSGKVKFYED